MPTDPSDRIEFSEEGRFFTCPVPCLGGLVKFLDAEGVDIFKVESGICPRTDEEVRFVYLEAGTPVRGRDLVEKFRNSLG